MFRREGSPQKPKFDSHIAEKIPHDVLSDELNDFPVFEKILHKILPPRSSTHIKAHHEPMENLTVTPTTELESVLENDTRIIKAVEYGGTPEDVENYIKNQNRERLNNS